jgi:hypothetical protein
MGRWWDDPGREDGSCRRQGGYYVHAAMGLKLWKAWPQPARGSGGGEPGPTAAGLGHRSGAAEQPGESRPRGGRQGR